MSNTSPNILIQHDNGVMVVELLNEEILEEPTINSIADSLFNVIMENPGVRMALSFKQVKHFSSSALGMLIRLNKRIEQASGELCLTEIRPSLMEIFIITKLNKLFTICETRAEALKTLKS